MRAAGVLHGERLPAEEHLRAARILVVTQLVTHPDAGGVGCLTRGWARVRAADAPGSGSAVIPY
jgi:hypothetical protein